MDTTEHTKLGNAIRYTNLQNNPYLRVDENGVLYFKLQRLKPGVEIPAPMLEVSAGEAVAMMGDYFTKADWWMHLHLHEYLNLDPDYVLDAQRVSEIAEGLDNLDIEGSERIALMAAYNKFASPKVSRELINNIYKINDKKYIPFSETLNFYAQQFAFYWDVDNYGKMLDRNQTHFTPWASRVYVIAHAQALLMAQYAYEIKQYAKDKNFKFTDKTFAARLEAERAKNPGISLENIAHRYHALALSIEISAYHYFTDHFASGHMSMVGMLRTKLPHLFGVWGGLLVNSLHDELNFNGVRTKVIRSNEFSNIMAYGDSSFSDEKNKKMQDACIDGMHASIADLDSVLDGGAIPHQKDFAGLKYLPDIDFRVRQPSPLIVLGQDNKIYYRSDISKITMLSPLQYQQVRENPAANGYKELKNSLQAFWLVFKLRVLSFIYGPTLQEPSAQQLSRIEQDELFFREPAKAMQSSYAWLAQQQVEQPQNTETETETEPSTAPLWRKGGFTITPEPLVAPELVAN